MFSYESYWKLLFAINDYLNLMAEADPEVWDSELYLAVSDEIYRIADPWGEQAALWEAESRTMEEMLAY